MGHVIISKETREPIRAYMLGVEWLYEIDGDLGTVIFPSVECLYDYHPLSYFREGRDYPQDGIVEVEIHFIRHIRAQECFKEKIKTEKECK